MDKFRLTECQTLDIPVGNDVPLLVKLVKGFDGCDGEGVVPFPIDVCENVVVTMVSERGQVKSVVHRLGTDGEVLLELQAGDFRAGLTYGIDVRATLNGKAVHAYGKSLVRITAATERGPRQVAQAADPYEVTLQVGYVGDLIPRRLDELEGYDDLMAEVGGKADAEEVGEALAAVGREFQKYIPLAQKAAAGGVAELDANRKVFNDQLYFAPRGTTTAAAMDGELDAGLYLVNGFKVADEVLGGDGANGFLLQATGASRGQLLVVGRAADAAAGEQVEIYTRRYLPTPKRWTAWSKGAGGGGSDTFLVRFSLQGTNTLVSDKSYQEIQKAVRAGKMVYAIYDDAVYILGYCQGGSATFYLSSDRYVVTYSLQIDSTVLTKGVYTIPDAMSQSEAEAGSVTVSRVISPSVLKGAILYHTSDLVNGGAYNSTSKKIELKHGSTVVAEIDATPFIVDGMVEDVRIENGNLVIDFNTESGKQDIAIPLTDIFDPSNYYTKQQTDGLLAGKASTADVSALQQQVAGKQDTISDLSTIRQNAAAVVTKKKKTTIVVATNTADPSQPVTSVFCNLSTYYRIPVPIESLTLMLPPNPQSGYVENIVVYLTGGTAPAVTIRSGDINPSPIYYHDGYAIESGNTYELNILWNGAAWVVASVEIVINN